MVSAAQAPSVVRVEFGAGRVLPFLPVVGEHAVLRRSLCATLTALIDPLAAPSGAIAYGLTPYPVLRAEVVRIGLLRLRLDRSSVQDGDPGAKRRQARHRSRRVVRRGSNSRKAHRARPLRARACIASDEADAAREGCDASDLRPLSHHISLCGRLQQGKPLIAKLFRTARDFALTHAPCRFCLTSFQA